MTVKIRPSTSGLTLSPRLSTWTSPDGRTLTKDDEFEYQAKPGGHFKEYRFVAFVDDGPNSHIEAVLVVGPKSLRALRPEGVRP